MGLEGLDDEGGSGEGRKRLEMSAAQMRGRKKHMWL